MKRTAILILSLMILVLLFDAASPALSQPQRPDIEQITAFLKGHPFLTDSGAEVLSVTVLGEALVIDLTSEVLKDGSYDETPFIQLEQDLELTFNINQYYMLTFKVEGQTLEFWGRSTPDFESQLSQSTIIEPQGIGPLAGVRVALSPGHGWYWNEIYLDWRYQRSEFWGIREDTINSEIMRYVQFALVRQGATVIQLRELDKNYPPGISGLPAWYEAARHYAIALGLPSWVWDGSNTNYNSDIRARPYMANYYDADILISLHNNGWDGTLTGTETYWDTNNHPGSQSLANSVHTSIISTIRAKYDSNWTNRGVKASDSNYGEINYAHMPAILVELAFMDTYYPDNTYLHDETFKKLAATAIAKGICDFKGVTCDFTPPVLDIHLYLPMFLRQ